MARHPARSARPRRCRAPRVCASVRQCERPLRRGAGDSPRAAEGSLDDGARRERARRSKRRTSASAGSTKGSSSAPGTTPRPTARASASASRRSSASACTCRAARRRIPSSVLMNAVPAKVAGVKELVMVSPNPHPLVLAAAALAGVDRVLALGGAHAVAALAYGTPVLAARRQDRRPGQRLRGGGEAPGVRRGRHRHGGGPLGDPGDLRRQHAGRLDRDGSFLPGRARRGGAGHPAFAARAATSTRWRRRSAACSRACRGATPSPRRSPRAAR